MSELVTSVEEQNYFLITMDDGKANALSFDMFEQLNAALDRAQQAGKVVVLAGRPGKFSAGFDLSVMQGGGERVVALLREGESLSRRLLSFATPIVIAASGHALAMGALLLLSADYRIGMEGEYKLGLNEVAIGMTLPHFGVEMALARLSKRHVNVSVGLARLYDAPGAMEVGYLDEVVAPEQLLSRAVELAEQLSALDMQAYKNTKLRVRAGLFAAMDLASEQELGV